MKRALITGAYGQDGSYIAELLVSSGYEVYGIVRNELSLQSLKNKQELLERGIKIQEVNAELGCYQELLEVFDSIKPCEIYHMAACHVPASGEIHSASQYQDNVVATSNILAAAFRAARGAHIVTAGSCLMFDNSDTIIQDENTPYNSLSLYGIAKISENQLLRYYRSQGMHCCTAILYNHESHRRQDSFVTKKIAKKMIALSKGEIKSFSLGSLSAQKDWGLASDYAKAMIKMAHANTPKDYILATGKLHSIQDYIDTCAEKLKMNGYMDCIEVDASFINREIRGTLRGNAEKIKSELGWSSTTSLRDIVDDIIDYEEKTEK